MSKPCDLENWKLLAWTFRSFPFNLRFRPPNFLHSRWLTFHCSGIDGQVSVMSMKQMGRVCGWISSHWIDPRGCREVSAAWRWRERIWPVCRPRRSVGGRSRVLHFESLRRLQPDWLRFNSLGLGRRKVAVLQVHFTSPVKLYHVWIVNSSRACRVRIMTQVYPGFSWRRKRRRRNGGDEARAEPNRARTRTQTTRLPGRWRRPNVRPLKAHVYFLTHINVNVNSRLWNPLSKAFSSACSSRGKNRGLFSSRNDLRISLTWGFVMLKLHYVELESFSRFFFRGWGGCSCGPERP